MYRPIIKTSRAFSTTTNGPFQKIKSTLREHPYKVAAVSMPLVVTFTILALYARHLHEKIELAEKRAEKNFADLVFERQRLNSGNHDHANLNDSKDPKVDG